jgi:hypothetical protein
MGSNIGHSAKVGRAELQVLFAVGGVKLGDGAKVWIVDAKRIVEVGNWFKVWGIKLGEGCIME